MLTDRYKRKLDYLRISVTDKCNLRCIYCMPEEGVTLLPHDEVLRNEEFVHFVEIFHSLGVKKVRFTGGEPLIRKGFVDIIARIRELLPDIELCLTTNGTLLGEALDDIYRIKLKKLNISLDTMSRSRFKEITGRDNFDRVITNIEKAIDYNFFDIKINSVLFEESLDELDSLLDYIKDKNIIIRFIERMSFFDNSNTKTFVSSDKLIEILRQKGTLRRKENVDTKVAQMFELQYLDKYNIKIGVIPPITHNFCSKCNRLRLTCDGFLKTCLHSSIEYDLKGPYRMDMGDEALKDIILKAVSEKPLRHDFDCAVDNNSGCASIVSGRSMSKIGG